MFSLKLRTKIVLQNIWPSQFRFVSAPHGIFHVDKMWLSILTYTCRIRAVFGSPNPKTLFTYVIIPPCIITITPYVWQKPHLWFEMAYPQKHCDVRVMFFWIFAAFIHDWNGSFLNSCNNMYIHSFLHAFLWNF